MGLVILWLLPFVCMLPDVAQTEVAPASRWPLGPPLLPYWQCGVLGVLSTWIYWRTLAHLTLQWWRDPNFSHGFLVPLFSAYAVWQARDQLSRIKPRPSWYGVAVLLGA